MTAIAAQVAAMLTDDFWKTQGLRDVQLGADRKGYAASKLELCERIVELVHGPTPRGIAEAVQYTRTMLTWRMRNTIDVFGAQSQAALTEELGDLARRVAAMAPAAEPMLREIERAAGENCT